MASQMEQTENTRKAKAKDQEAAVHSLEEWEVAGMSWKAVPAGEASQK